MLHSGLGVGWRHGGQSPHKAQCCTVAPYPTKVIAPARQPGLDLPPCYTTALNSFHMISNIWYPTELPHGNTNVYNLSLMHLASGSHAFNPNLNPYPNHGINEGSCNNEFVSIYRTTFNIRWVFTCLNVLFSNNKCYSLCIKFALSNDTRCHMCRGRVVHQPFSACCKHRLCLFCARQLSVMHITLVPCFRCRILGKPVTFRWS